MKILNFHKSDQMETLEESFLKMLRCPVILPSKTAGLTPPRSPPVGPPTRSFFSRKYYWAFLFRPRVVISYPRPSRSYRRTISVSAVALTLPPFNPEVPIRVAHSARMIEPSPSLWFCLSDRVTVPARRFCHKSADNQIQLAIQLLRNLFDQSQVDAGHGIDHALIILGHAEAAVEVDRLAGAVGQTDNFSEKRLVILLAALLHDADETKFFPSGLDYPNARQILEQINLEPSLVSLVIHMISLVSCAQNGNSLVTPAWLLIPRWADRLEAMGQVGILRTKIYGEHIGRPVFLPTTPRATTRDELTALVSPARFLAYRGHSDSTMDHFYDKVLHLHHMATDNVYLKSLCRIRHEILVEFCLDFGRTGQVNFAKFLPEE